MLNTLINDAYKLFVLLDHWKNPTAATTAMLEGLDTNDLYKYKSLIEYHVSFLSNGQENYPLLRKGLDEYFDKDLSDIFKLISLTGRVLFMLDYGAGNGKYSDQFLYDNPASVVMAIDRQPVFDKPSRSKQHLNVDFEKEPDWWYPYQDQLDVVFMSELLHCKDVRTQEYLIHSSRMLLKKCGGLLIINENNDLAMQWRIGKLKSTFLSLPDVAKLCAKGFKLINLQKINLHTISVYEKI